LDASHGEHHHIQQSLGIALHEWRGSSGRTRRWLALQPGHLVLSTMVVGYGNYLRRRLTDIVDLYDEVQIRFHLRKPLEESDYHSIAAAHTTYGIQKITVAPSLEDLMVEYECHRLRPPKWRPPSPPPGIPIPTQHRQFSRERRFFRSNAST